LNFYFPSADLLLVTLDLSLKRNDLEFLCLQYAFQVLNDLLLGVDLNLAFAQLLAKNLFLLVNALQFLSQSTDFSFLSLVLCLLSIQRLYYLLVLVDNCGQLLIFLQKFGIMRNKLLDLFIKFINDLLALVAILFLGIDELDLFFERPQCIFELFLHGFPFLFLHGQGLSKLIEFEVAIPVLLGHLVVLLSELHQGFFVVLGHIFVTFDGRKVALNLVLKTFGLFVQFFDDHSFLVHFFVFFK